MDTDIDTELLITEVQKKSNLWDASNESYKDRDLRIKVWEEIGAFSADSRKGSQKRKNNLVSLKFYFKYV